MCQIWHKNIPHYVCVYPLLFDIGNKYTAYMVLIPESAQAGQKLSKRWEMAGTRVGWWRRPTSQTSTTCSGEDCPPTDAPGDQESQNWPTNGNFNWQRFNYRGYHFTKLTEACTPYLYLICIQFNGKREESGSRPTVGQCLCRVLKADCILLYFNDWMHKFINA